MLLNQLKNMILSLNIKHNIKHDIVEYNFKNPWVEQQMLQY